MSFSGGKTEKEAMYYEVTGNQAVVCHLCPHLCRLEDGKQGICGVRLNRGGILYAENYGKLSSIHMDPIEKKPLYHFFPGSMVLSVGSVGCNLHCSFCQNWQIARANASAYQGIHTYTPSEIAGLASERSQNIGVAYTYNEPVVFYEFMLDTAKLVSKQGGKNIMVTNGYIEAEPLRALFPYMDAFAVDLKGFEDGFFRKYTRSELEPVKKSLIAIAGAGKHLEITNLVIPGLNDDRALFNTMVLWIREMLGEETVFHISRYFPSYRLSIESTPISTMQELYEIAREQLKFVYLGNVHGQGQGNQTFCPGCGEKAIGRTGYHTDISGLDSRGNCHKCGHKIIKHI